VLEAHEIRAMLFRDNAGGMLPALQPHFRIRLAVPGPDAERARKILEAEPGAATGAEAEG
jgi:hypothetical protein